MKSIYSIGLIAILTVLGCSVKRPATAQTTPTPPVTMPQTSPRGDAAAPTDASAQGDLAADPTATISDTTLTAFAEVDPTTMIPLDGYLTSGPAPAEQILATFALRADPSTRRLYLVERRPHQLTPIFGPFIDRGANGEPTSLFAEGALFSSDSQQALRGGRIIQGETRFILVFGETHLTDRVVVVYYVRGTPRYEIETDTLGNALAGGPNHDALTANYQNSVQAIPEVNPTDRSFQTVPDARTGQRATSRILGYVDSYSICRNWVRQVTERWTVFRPRLMERLIPDAQRWETGVRGRLDAYERTLRNGRNWNDFVRRLSRSTPARVQQTIVNQIWRRQSAFDALTSPEAHASGFHSQVTAWASDGVVAIRFCTKASLTEPRWIYPLSRCLTWTPGIVGSVFRSDLPIAWEQPGRSTEESAALYFQNGLVTEDWESFSRTFAISPLLRGVCLRHVNRQIQEMRGPTAAH